MAEVTAFRNNALPYPVRGVPFALVFPIVDADQVKITGATGLDSQISLNGDALVACTNEATEIGTSGWYYLLLTATEMLADTIIVDISSTSTGAKNVMLTLYPRKLVPLRSGTAQGGAVGYITFDASAGTRDDVWNGCLCVATIDGNVEARIITNYTGSNQQGAVTPDWNVAPDSDDTFVIYLPEGMQVPEVSNITEIKDAIHNGTVLNGTVDAGATATSIPVKTLDITLTTTDQLKGRSIIFDKNTTTAALRGQGAPIYGSTTTHITIFTPDAFTTAPAEDDVFRIV